MPQWESQGKHGEGKMEEAQFKCTQMAKKKNSCNVADSGYWWGDKPNERENRQS